MLFFLPKRKISIFDRKRINSRQIREFRRFNIHSTNYFVIYIISIWMLVFALRIGTLLTVYFTHFTEFDFASALQGINLPISKSFEFIENKRLRSFISIDAYGHYKIDDGFVDQNNLELYLKNKKLEIPSIIVCVIADKKCKMESINNLILLLKKYDCQRLFFYTKQNHSLALK